MRPDDARFKTRHFYDRISPVYDLVADSSEHEARELGVRLLAPTPGQTVLEIGCGTGHGLVSLAKAVGQNGRVYGIDVSAGMLAVAHRHVMAPGVRRVHLAMSDARSLCFPSSAFDAIFMGFTLELFESAIPDVLAEVRRVLTPAGRVGIVAMAERVPTNTASRVYEWAHQHWPHLVDCRPIDAESALRTAGFATVQVASTDIWTLPVTVVVGERKSQSER